MTTASKRRRLLITAVITNLLLLSSSAWAGPGGMIARAAFETPLGRIALLVLTILFLPLIIYTLVTEKLAERRALKDLAWMAGRSPLFDWLSIRLRITDCFQRVHSAWSEEDVSTVAGWMEDWYWQNQQLVHLNNWRKNGLLNVCNVKKINSLKPLLFAHRNEGGEHDNSLLVVAISAHMQDWLQKRGSDEIVEGSKKWKDVETVWTFRLNDGVWRVANIEEGVVSLQYAKLVKALPRIEETVGVRA
jgi:hypothetical protein